MSGSPQVALRNATPADADQVAEIGRPGWQDGHRGFVPPELVRARTEESFRARAFYEKAGWQDEGLFDYSASAETGIVVPARRYAKSLSGP